MVLGAGVYQVPLIKQAKSMGIETLVVSVPGNYPGFAFGDKIYYEDTRDYEKILEIARNEQIDGIVTTGTDVAVVTIGKVCDALGLSGLSFEAGKTATDKMLMKQKYEEYGVRTARYRRISLMGAEKEKQQDSHSRFENQDKDSKFIEYLEKELEGLQFPLIFKAVDTSGSRGIVKAEDSSKFVEAYRAVRENTRKDYFIVEEFLEGEEFGAQSFVCRGEVQFILPHGDYVFQGDTGVPIGHWAPYELEQSVIEDAKEQLQKAVKAMGLDNCALNADFILSGGKPYVLEIGGRAGATCLTELVSLYYGYNYYEKIIQAALGLPVDFASEKACPNVGMLLRSENTGVIQEIVNRNDREDKQIVEIQFDYQVGDEVQAFRVGPHRIGHVVVQADTLEEAKHKMEEALGNIEVWVSIP
ncbi:ATP-grasp domain-containing protein [Petralouisia muris]|uniref:ATP-grasp domain-containing protein n=1 Tax=Petralouisia muris TaxID=3032872 RepID=A0AC61RWW1_9FIRM|nr:ATP-grasp domain-containing protein [Petralouisia muris]TGY96408.1 ATP-grasp domain-containing protein [Petralouisia muris]